MGFMTRERRSRWLPVLLLITLALVIPAASGCRSSDQGTVRIITPPASSPIAGPAEVLERVRERVPFAVKAPAYLPSGFSLVGADTTIPQTVVPGQTPSIDAEVRLTYQSDRGGTIVITETLQGVAAAPPGATPVPISSKMGWLTTSEANGDGTATEVTWSEGGVSYRVTGYPLEQVSSDEVVRVARSMDAEGFVAFD